MARKVKCVYCKKEGTTDTCHKEVIKGKNKYFCNIVEYEMYELNEQRKQEIMTQRNELIIWIVTEYYNYETGMLFPKTLNKRLTPLFNFYPIDVIRETFINNHEIISWAIKNKEFTEYGMTCYIMTVIEGSINDVYKNYAQRKQQIEKELNKKSILDVSLFEEVTSDTIIVNKNKKDISQFLD